MEEFGSPKKWSRVKETLKKAPVWHKSIRNIVDKRDKEGIIKIKMTAVSVI